MKTLAFLLATLTATTTALPNAVAIPVESPNSCVYYPSWINTRDNDITGSIMFVPAFADDEATNNLPLQQYSLRWGGGQRRLLGTDFRASRRFAKGFYRCWNGQLYLGSGRFSSSENVAISKDANNAHLLVGETPERAYRPELYYLEVNGKRLDGVYLGAKNRTTWGFHYHNAQCGANGLAQDDFQEAKLLDLPVDDDVPPTAGYEPIFSGFLKVISY